MEGDDPDMPEYQLELLDPGVREDPYALYDSMREHAPVYESPFGTYLVADHSLVLSILQDQSMSTDLRRIELDPAVAAQLDSDSDSTLGEGSSALMLFTDPPDHRRLRSLVSKAFTPRSVEQLKPRIDAIVADLVGTCREKGRVDFIEDLAYPLPITVICEMMGVPVEDRESFSAWSRMVAPSIDPAIFRDPDTEATIREGAAAFDDYFRHLFDARREQPGADLVTRLLEAEEAGDRLSEAELLGTCVFLLVAGHETTVNLIGNGLLALLRSPETMRRLRDDADIVASAVEEFLRFDSPVQLTIRIPTEPLELDGVVIPPGRPITLLLGAANRDPRVFDAPDRLDIAREVNPHVAFGGGIHHCLGAPLARAEAQSVFTALKRVGIEQTDEIERKSTFTLRGLAHLPVEFA